MTSNSTDLLRCRLLIEQKLNWGDADHWTAADFEQLQQQILDETGVLLSVSTLRRVWGRVDYRHLPSSTTLNTLARFAGFVDWRQFMQPPPPHLPPDHPIEEAPKPPTKTAINWQKLGWLSGALGLISLIGFIWVRTRQPPLPTTPYQFSSQPVTRTIPNSVIFNYDASTAPTDSVYIQQSWDPTRRELVSRNGHTHTSIYYEPGFYRAKLVVGQQVVKEHLLLVPTQGWLGTITTSPVPVYLTPTDFIDGGLMRLTTATIRQKNIPLQPQAPLVKYTNVGNFSPVPVSDFTFSCRVKSEYSEGSAACQLAWVVLLTDEMPISIPLSAKGCISELVLVDGVRQVSGKTTNLSAFGVDFTDWIGVSCHSDGRKLYCRINNHLAYSARLPTKKTSIIGILYGFRGTGGVKQVRLQSKNKLVFSAF